MWLMRDVNQVREEMLRDASTYKDEPPISKGYKGALVNHLNKAMSGDLRRQIALCWLFRYDNPPEDGLLSTSKLTEGEWHAISKWVDVYKEPDSDEWLVSARFPSEAKAAADVAEIDYYARHVVELDPMFDDYPEAVKEAIRLGGVLKDVFEDIEPEPRTRLERFRRSRRK